jgi:hypothetical protein
MSIVLQSSGGGSVTIAEPATASNFTATLPAATGDVMVSGNMPAFGAYVNSAQTITGLVSTKVAFDGESFDTNNCYNTANYRFTPNVAGYYQINATVMLANNTVTSLYIMIYKNGTNYSRGGFTTGTASAYPTTNATNIVYCNGTTDYIEIYAYFFATNDVGGGALGSSTAYSSFTGAMVRGA